jgi:hypothetical protein
MSTLFSLITFLLVYLKLIINIGTITSYNENHHMLSNRLNVMKKLTYIVDFDMVINKCRLAAYFLPLTQVFIMIFI